MNFDNKTVLVTGASGGIGAAIARKLLDGGAAVLLTGRSATALKAQREALGEYEGRLETLAADLTNAEHRARLVTTASSWRGGIDVLINNAGVSQFGMFEDLQPDQLSRTLAVNVEAPILLTQALLGHLISRAEAHIVNVGSVFGAIGYPGFAAYSASKFALRGFNEALRRELSDSSVQVHYIAPRATATAFNSATIVAMNAELGVQVDHPTRVAREVCEVLQKGRIQRTVGWPEKLFVRINALLPGFVDRSIARQLSTIRCFAGRPTTRRNAAPEHVNQTFARKAS